LQPHFKEIVMDKMIKLVQEQFIAKNNLPAFRAGDTVNVAYKIREGNKERIQQFQGVVLQRRGQGATATFTVRKISNGLGVERIFPISSPFIESLTLLKRGKVRRARLFYLRNVSGKAARIKERIISKNA